MLELQQDNQFFIFNFDHTVTDQTLFFDPQFWQKNNRTLGSAQGRGTTYFLRTEDLFGVNTALRHYYRGGLWGKVNRDRYQFTSLTTTRSFAEFHLLHRLQQAGLSVPKPIGAKVEKTSFSGYRADILTQKIENAHDLTAILQKRTLPEQIWIQIGAMIAKLHQLQICHTDLNAHNILLQQTDETMQCWLIDFDKCGEKTGNSWKAKNLMRLQRSFLKEVKRMNIQFNNKNWQQLMDGYSQL